MKKIILTLLLMPSGLFAQEFSMVSFIETNYSKVEDSTLCQKAIDSLTTESNVELEQGTNWNYGAYYKSDDGLINIYHFSGEGCGVYCNPMYQTVIAIDIPETKTNYFIETDDLNFDLDSIITIEKGRFYLIFGNLS